MTREQAIKWLKTFRGRYGMNELEDAVDVAIKALEKHTEERTGTHVCDCISRETHACDCISRQAVLDRINKLIEVEKKQGTDDWGYGRERVNAYETMLHMVENEYLYPSVEPERKNGKWIKVVNPDTNEWDGGYTCSECWRACVQMSMKYCANCGAPMEVQDEY